MPCAPPRASSPSQQSPDIGTGRGAVLGGRGLRGVSRAALSSAGKADGFSTAQISVSFFCSGSAVVGPRWDSPA